jgi:hypothetical protein
MIRIENLDGTEIASDSISLANWRHFKETSKDGHWIRSAFVVFSHNCTSSKPVSYQFRWGTPRTVAANSNITPRNVSTFWREQAPPEIGEHPATDNYWIDTSAPKILEPKVWVSLPAAWLASTNIHGPIKLGALPDLQAHRVAFAKTYVNDVNLDVTAFESADNGRGLIDWRAEVEGWLYDRPMVLADLYISTGDVKWMRHMHRAAQFYASWVAMDSTRTPRVRGTFIKATANDVKYSLNGGLFAAYLLTGDARIYDRIEAIADFLETQASAMRLFPITKATGLWTERNLSTTISGLVYGYEATGRDTYKNRVKQILDGMKTDVTTPPAGYPSAQQMAGVLFHRPEVHEGSSWNDLYMSPWMSALLGDSLWRYFMLSDDTLALDFLSNYAQVIAEKAIYSGQFTDPYSQSKATFFAPYYGVGLTLKYSQNGIFEEREHALDVAGILARGRWARQMLGLPTTLQDEYIPQLLRTAMTNFPYWTRTTAGWPLRRISPTRKFAWWFLTTHDFTWFSPLGR